MKTKRYRRPSWSVLRPAGLYVAVLLSVAAFAACWLQFLDGGIWQVAISCFGLGAIAGLVWDSRARATCRLRTAVDLYAEREIAREMSRRAGASRMGREAGRHIAA
jgi:hypothetical protein